MARSDSSTSVCVKVLTERQRRRIVHMVHAAVNRRKTDLRELMIESGFLTADSTLTADETYRWWEGIIYELLAAQPANLHRASLRTCHPVPARRAVRGSPHAQNVGAGRLRVFLEVKSLDERDLHRFGGPPSTSEQLLTTWTAWLSRSRSWAVNTTSGSASAACLSEWITMTTTDVTAARLPLGRGEPIPVLRGAAAARAAWVWDDTAQAWLVLSYDAARQVLGGSGWTSDPLANMLARASMDVVSQGLHQTVNAFRRRRRASTSARIGA